MSNVMGPSEETKGHRPKNGPKRPHFREKIRKMCHFCLILEILGGGMCPPAPPLMEALLVIDKSLKIISEIHFNYYIEPSRGKYFYRKSKIFPIWS